MSSSRPVIRDAIIHQLSLNANAQYSELRPDWIEKNAFSYHLNQLIKDKLIERQEQGVYRLTKAGAIEASRLSSHNTRVRPQPLCLIFLVGKFEKKYLVWRRKNKPFQQKLDFVQGKVHLGETKTAAANREAGEKIQSKVKLQYIRPYELIESIGSESYHVWAEVYETEFLEEPNFIEHWSGRAYFVDKSELSNSDAVPWLSNYPIN